MYFFTSELTEVEARERVGALPLCLVCWEGTILSRDRDPPSKGEETVLDHHTAAVVGTRMYVWNGRDGYKKVWNNQISPEKLG